VGKVYNLCRVKTDRPAVLTVKSGLDPHMIIKLKDGIKSWFIVGFLRRDAFLNCRAYSPGTHARKEEDGLLLEFPL
jgi:hypothetical protein